jgi:hypothetical protein
MGLKPGVANTGPDFVTAVRLGRVSGHELVVVGGHASGLGVTSAGINASSVDLVRISQATTVRVASTNALNDVGGGSGALVVKIEGLDANYEPQEEEVTMNGSAIVTTVKTWRAINGVEVVSAGVAEINIGDIHVGSGAFTSGIPATKYYILEAEHGHGFAGVYTVPVGKTFIMLMAHTMVRAAAKTLQVNINVFHHAISTVHIMSVPLHQAEGSMTMDVRGADRIDEKDTITLAGFVGQATADVAVSVQGLLIDNELVDP